MIPSNSNESRDEELPYRTVESVTTRISRPENDEVRLNFQVELSEFQKTKLHPDNTSISTSTIASSMCSIHSSSSTYRNYSFYSNLNQKKPWADFFKKLLAFMGPGFMVSVGYLDPGNWATDLVAGSQFGYRLLFIVFLSNLMAMLLQSLCVRLGIITGLDLAQSCRKYIPRFPSLILYVLCEIAIMATDLAEVIGSAIALQLLFKIPVLYGVLITGLDVFIIIMIGFNSKHMRVFEFGIALLVLLTACCLFAVSEYEYFDFKVAGKSNPNMLDVLYGYLPTPEIVTQPGSIYVAVGIIGATVMPHNLYLHSSIVKYRSKNEDGLIRDIELEDDTIPDNIQPLRRKEMLPAILQMSYLDSIFALTFALFVNSAILIISAANFFQKGTEVAEIPDAFKLIGDYLGSVFATLFAVALLLAGQSSTITGTMAGQIVMEGFLGNSFRVAPWIRRLITRSFAIFPALISIIVFGEQSLNNLLIISQIVLSLQLPFAVWPLIYFTSKSDIMTLSFQNSIERTDTKGSSYAVLPSPSTPEKVDFSNDRLTLFAAVFVGCLLTVFNILLIVEFFTSP